MLVNSDETACFNRASGFFRSKIISVWAFCPQPQGPWRRSVPCRPQARAQPRPSRVVSDAALTPVMQLMPVLPRSFAISCPRSASSVGARWGAASTMVTLLPIALKKSAISRPIAPGAHNNQTFRHSWHAQHVCAVQNSVMVGRHAGECGGRGTGQQG